MPGPFARRHHPGMADAGRVVGLAAALPLIAVSVRWFGVRRTARILARLHGSSEPRRADASELAAAERLAQLAALAGRWSPFSTSCLRQALLVHWLLRKRGLAPELKLGVRKHGGGLDAHAWVVLQGAALGQFESMHVPFSGERLRSIMLS